jgi:hypothetical protein
VAIFTLWQGREIKRRICYDVIAANEYWREMHTAGKLAEEK